MELMDKAVKLAARCSDAYSYDRYANWTAVAKLLLDLGLTENQAEAVMRSKWTRWAADQSSASYGYVPAKEINRFLVSFAKDEIRKLTKETLGKEE